MRRFIILCVVIGASLVGIASVFQSQERLIWNRTASAPTGLYWLRDDPFTPGRWVIVSARSDDARWAQSRGYIGKDWPLLKQIAGVSGDEVCRNDGSIVLNGERVGHAKTYDSQGRALPVWTGCMTLLETDVFLMNPHPDSLDGRYFGATDLSELDGVAALIWEF